MWGVDRFQFFKTYRVAAIIEKPYAGAQNKRSDAHPYFINVACA
jgi:hypothetical protein